MYTEISFGNSLCFLHIFLLNILPFSVFKKDLIYLLLEREEDREREGEKHQYERETLIAFLLL